MARKCGGSYKGGGSCGMSQGIYNPFFQNGAYWYGQGVLDPAYQAVIDYATAQGYQLPTSANIVAQNQLVVTLKSIGAWDALDVFRLYRQNGDSDFARLNWKNPAIYKALEVSSPFYTRKSGYSGNGTSSYLNGVYIPGSNGINYTQNSASFIAGIISNISSSTFFDVGASDASLADRTILNSRQTTSAVFGINAQTASTGTSNDSIANWIVQRRASNDLRMWKNGSQLATATTASTGVPNVAFYELAENRNGTAAGFSPRILSYIGYGSSLSGLEAGINDAINTYYATLSTYDPDEVQILWKGDSITSGVGPTLTNGSYPLRSAAALNIPINNTNLGTPSQTASQMIFLKAELDPYLPTTDVFVLEGGVNDILLASPRTAADIWADLLALCQYAQAFGVTKVLVGTIMDSSNFDAARDTIRDDLNTLIRNNAAGNGITVIDWAANVNLATQNATYYSDHVHLNDAGTAIQATITAAAISTLL